MLRAVAVAVLFGCFVGIGGAEEKDFPKFIVGKWAMSVEGKKDIPDGMALEFTKDGKMMMVINLGGKENSVEIGSYKIEKNVVVVTPAKGKGDGKEKKLKIKELTENAGVLIDEEDKVEIKVTKKK